MTLLYHRGPNVAMQRDSMRFESLIEVPFNLRASRQWYLSGITKHAHPGATKIAAKPMFRLVCFANPTFSMVTRMVNHGCR